MPIGSLIDWNGRRVKAATSRGGTVALSTYADNLIRGKHSLWPQAAIVQKLSESTQADKFEADELQFLSQSLGYYCNLQSLNSEDAITWSFFGTLMAEPQAVRTKVLNWISYSLELPSSNNDCDINLFQRIPHPDKLIAINGPEIDVVLRGDKTVMLIEAKWLSKEGKGQGPDGLSTQIGLRQKFISLLGKRIYSDAQAFGVVGLTLEGREFDSSDPISGAVTHALTWQTLCSCYEHPLIDEYRRYFEWKMYKPKLVEDEQSI